MTQIEITSSSPTNCPSDSDSTIRRSSRIKVCVIGAGAAGLVNTRWMKTRLDIFDVEVYEKSNNIGGTWVYDDRIQDEDGRPIHSSMYKNLRSNLPMCIMQFSDFDCHPEKNGFVSHEDVLSYLKDYCHHHDLLSFIKFGHEVVNISRSQDSWLVSIRDDNHNITTKFFDSVLVCNGRYSKPKIPDMNSIESFQGKIIHVHNYKRPEDFSGQSVVVFGAGPSGVDIALEMTTVAQQVYLCHSLPKTLTSLGEKVIQVNSSIHSFEGKNILLKSGQVLKDIDSVLLATGYEYEFGFLDESCKISVTSEGRVKDLYLHLVNAHYPSMGIWGVPVKMLPFPLFEQQAKFFMKHLMKEFELPFRSDMLKDSEKDYQERLLQGIPPRHAHKMSTSKMLWDYEGRLVLAAGITPIKPVVKDLYKFLAVCRPKFLNEYKEWRFTIISDHEFQWIRHDQDSILPFKSA